MDPVIAYKWYDSYEHAVCTFEAQPLIVVHRRLGEKLTRGEYDTAVEEMKVFDEFMLEDVMSTQSRPLLVLPVGLDSTSYRDQYFGSAEESGSQVQGYGFSSLVFPPLVGMPTFVIPIGQYPYRSRVSGQEEFLPMCVTITGSKGEDFATLDLMQDFLESSPDYKTAVLTGKEAFL